jgi:O-antigen/teichoic acid export membrane protein
MEGDAIVTVSAAVFALTQLIKWTGLPDRWGPASVLVLAALGVGIWVYSQGDFMREDAFELFAAWVAVATSAAGVFGFSRAAAGVVTSLTHPPTGAGQEPTK